MPSTGCHGDLLLVISAGNLLFALDCLTDVTGFFTQATDSLFVCVCLNIKRNLLSLCKKRLGHASRRGSP